MDEAPVVETGPSLRARFAVAIALTIAFYTLAIALALALIGLPVWGWVAIHHVNLWLTVFGVTAGFTILSAIVPRREPFTEPGPKVDAGSQPELMALVDSVARDTRQDPPADTYATLEANAAVTQVGSVLRGGGRRVLIIGLPLVRILTVDELRAVLAHEFGHYAGGDTRVAEWTFRTRRAIERTIVGLHDEKSWGRRALQRPFIWYGNAFLRITSAIERRQEFAADAWAARIAGGDTHTSALRKVHQMAPAYDAYWSQEVLPALDSGVLPPLGEGFSRYLAVPRIQQACDETLADELGRERSSPYSSHPTLPERLAAVPEGDARDEAADEPATGLIRDPEELEREVLARMAKAAGAPPLEPIDWDQMGQRVYARNYEGMVEKHRGVLEGVTVATLPAAALDPGPIARRAFGEGVGTDTYPLVLATLSAGLTLTLAAQGWAVEAPLGNPVACRRGDAVVEPFVLVDELAARKLAADAWSARVAELGIEDAPLGLRDGAPATDPVA